MNRRTFIRQGCFACTSIGLLSMVVESCTTIKYSNGELTDDGLLLLDVKDFSSDDKARTYVIARHDDLQYPICVYRIGDNNYSAVLMRCSHQGAELQVFGDRLVCAAHGSEFDKWGHVLQAPAAINLRTFPVSVTGNKLFIDLRKQHS